MMTTLYLLLSLLLLLSCGKRINALSFDLLIGGILLLLLIYTCIQLIKKKKLIQELRINLGKQRNKQAENEKQIVQNNLLIQSLEKRLKENAKDKEVIRLRMETLEAENRSLQSVRISEIEPLNKSEVYLRFQNKQEWKVEPEDWKGLFQATDLAYPGFRHRLNGRLLKPTTQELQMCYLIKANVPPALIAQLLNCSATNISMTRKRLYEKIHGEKGSSAQFDQFIYNI